MELILQESIRIQSYNNKKGNKGNREKDIMVDTTVQEKNVTFPTDDKLYKKIIKRCVEISENESIKLRQNYKRTLKNLSYQQRFKKSEKQRKLAMKVSRRIKTIVGKLVRDLQRKLNLGQIEKYELSIELYKKVLRQRREDKNKIYCLYEPQTVCILREKNIKNI